MDEVARQSASERAALFNESGTKRGIATAIIEKDFWVCWILKRLFGLPETVVPGLAFKGGTSLSKAYDAIRRFSEDIDLSLDRAALGYRGNRDPEKASSAKKTKDLLEHLDHDVEHHVATVLLPSLKEAITAELGPPEKAGWDLTVD